MISCLAGYGGLIQVVRIFKSRVKDAMRRCNCPPGGQLLGNFGHFSSRDVLPCSDTVGSVSDRTGDLGCGWWE